MAGTEPIMAGVPEEVVGRRNKYVAQSEMYIYWIIWQNLPKVGKSCKKNRKDYEKLPKFGKNLPTVTKSWQNIPKVSKSKKN